jgi:hypothetical protein
MNMAWSHFTPWAPLVGGFVAVMLVGMVLHDRLLVKR